VRGRFSVNRAVSAHTHQSRHGANDGAILITWAFSR
jgi:hypothetical protein